MTSCSPSLLQTQVHGYQTATVLLLQTGLQKFMWHFLFTLSLFKRCYQLGQAWVVKQLAVMCSGVPEIADSRSVCPVFVVNFKWTPSSKEQKLSTRFHLHYHLALSPANC